jgi:xanthine dehydrogenase accessory factor
LLKEILAALQQSIAAGEPVALATVVDVQGASPAQVGFKLLVWPNGRSLGNIGGGALAQQVQEKALAALREGRSRLLHRALRESGPDATGSACGGEVTVFVEVFQPAPVLLIVGGGHIGRPLAEMARLVGMSVQVVDAQPERATVPQVDPATITSQTWVVLITESHEADELALRQVLGTAAAYIGMIGSRRKVAAIFDHLRADGVAEDQLARVHAPIGLDLGGRSPAEIALAILAEIVQVRYGGPGRPRSQGMSGRDQT